MIAENIRSVTRRIAKCCEKIGRSPESVKLVCVTKTASIEEIAEVLNCGLSSLGENRVQDALSKYAAIRNNAEWHLIGHLQTNKAKDAVSIFSLIHSVDSTRLAKEIDEEAGSIGKVQGILIQVNTSGEKSKFGIEPAAAIDFIKDIVVYPNISIKGLMTIAPEVEDPETVRPYFKALRELLHEVNRSQVTSHKLEVLSMGMTNDFEVAIEEGSNMVRIGRAIFGDTHDR